MTTHTDAPADDLVGRLESGKLWAFDSKQAAARIRSLEASCAAYREQVITLDLMKASAEAQRDEAVVALKEIKKLKPSPIGDTGFQTGPAALLNAAKRIAKDALDSLKEGR
ncbi:hypothetical protein [Brevundimonas sp. GCM10030266]|uniref:hypothetical protein n=1 Tax=Brevundimonas sp. GCM10030266 TaxID=3273386 RepID=UPI003616D9DA